jgi:hypothetical protein
MGGISRAFSTSATTPRVSPPTGWCRCTSGRRSACG